MRKSTLLAAALVLAAGWPTQAADTSHTDKLAQRMLNAATELGGIGTICRDEIMSGYAANAEDLAKLYFGEYGAIFASGDSAEHALAGMESCNRQRAGVLASQIEALRPSIIAIIHRQIVNPDLP